MIVATGKQLPSLSSRRNGRPHVLSSAVGMRNDRRILVAPPRVSREQALPPVDGGLLHPVFIPHFENEKIQGQ